VDRGMNFRGMFEAVAGDTALVPPERSLAAFLGSRGGMETLYREFAAWMIFARGGFLSKYPLATFSGATDRDVAGARSTLTLGSGREITRAFELPEGYAAQLWAIRLQKAARGKSGSREPVLVKVNEKTSGMVVDVFVVPSGQRTLSSAAPVKSLFTEDSSALVKAGVGTSSACSPPTGTSARGTRR